LHCRTSSMQRAIHPASIRDVFGRFKHKWGMHYTRSLWSAHKLQQVRSRRHDAFVPNASSHALTPCQCHNFKDPSVQLYGGSMFRASRRITLHLFLLGN